jgi:N6-adenosine-specific RNA methylase IME4
MNDLVKFDYDGLHLDIREKVKKNTREIQAIGRRMAEDIVKLGQKFSENQELLRHNKSGGFEAWYTSEGYEKNFVYRSIAIAEKFSTLPNLGKLSAPMEVLYQLSLPGIPEAARVEAVERSAGGEKITVEAAKGIAESHKRWQDKLDVKLWYPYNKKLNVVINDGFRTGNELHRKYPWGQSKTTYQKHPGYVFQQSKEFEGYKLVEPEQAPTYPKMEYTGEQSDEALAAAQWIQREYLKRNPGWSGWHDLLIIDGDPADLKKRLSDTQDPDHVTWGGLTHYGGPDRNGVRWEGISGGPRYVANQGSSPEDENYGEGWDAHGLYPVDGMRHWVFDHSLSEDDAEQVRDLWYPMCELKFGTKLPSRAWLAKIGWMVQPKRGEPEGDEQPEQAKTSEEPALDAELITGLVEGAYYCVDRMVHTIFNDPMDLSEATAYSPKYYHGCRFIKGKSINGHPRFKGWMIAERNRPPDYMPGSKPKVITAPQKFAAILIDPPWEYTTYSEDTGQGRSAEAHYPTMSAGDIASLPVGDLAADDCALFMWATWPTIQQAFAVGTAWGFEYKTCAFTWAKVKKGLAPDTHLRLNEDSNWHMGMGFWTRANSEVCLLFTKGRPSRMNKDVRQLIVASVRNHSQKPDEQYERIERLVKGPYLELFAREKREGWFAWGNEVEPDISFGGIQAAR